MFLFLVVFSEYFEKNDGDVVEVVVLVCFVD